MVQSDPNYCRVITFELIKSSGHIVDLAMSVLHLSSQNQDPIETSGPLLNRRRVDDDLLTGDESR